MKILVKIRANIGDGIERNWIDCPWADSLQSAWPVLSALASAHGFILDEIVDESGRFFYGRNDEYKASVLQMRMLTRLSRRSSCAQYLDL
jgi:hypothetical protein